MSIKPYYLPTEIWLGREPMMGSNGVLLAAASQIPEWMRANDLIRFYWFEEGKDPLIERLNRISVNSYGLNGVTYNHIMAAMEVINHHQSNQVNFIRPERDHPTLLYQSNLIDRYGPEHDLATIRGVTTPEAVEEALARLAHVPVPVDGDTYIPMLVPPIDSPWSHQGKKETFADLFKQSQEGVDDAAGDPPSFTGLIEPPPCE